MTPDCMLFMQQRRRNGKGGVGGGGMLEERRSYLKSCASSTQKRSRIREREEEEEEEASSQQGGGDRSLRRWEMKGRGGRPGGLLYLKQGRRQRHETDERTRSPPEKRKSQRGKRNEGTPAGIFWHVED
ncbi:uncharacterized protein ARB_00207 [Trichophyton benhamiae CBS 112371]|uniref:Uncharacterized protein n=1 Tax=Arthroderma benhamiae (strain ATCC MYA-4681 / CBS 112371) TaxID=663331 RepID=D4AVJ3_ARTBC|nr:uncharacterized protein ARB_00207 [Trichophyton benhamiae CBS 112371]EFE32749.1 hypothetical protein ARB_00207 [Trichophyton benhamiae CBS 112371]